MYHNKQIAAALMSLEAYEHPPVRDAVHAALRIMNEV